MNTPTALALAGTLLIALLLAAKANAQNGMADQANTQRYASANKRLGPPGSKPRVVLIGNSITDFWPEKDSAFFARSPYQLVGRGISGQVSIQMLARFRQDVINLKPKAVVILAGTNDVAENAGPYNPDLTLDNIRSMTELAQAHTIKVMLASVPPAAEFYWRPGLNPAPKIRALNQHIKSLAEQKAAVYLDYHTFLTDEAGGLPRTYSEDGVHPNLAGYRVMGPLLERAIGLALKSKKD